MSIALFFLVLFILILVHEWGHFIVAKKTGMRVDEFGIGFPPRLWGIKKGETLYSINTLPIGGFVRIYGENGADADGELGGKDITRSFSAKSKWAQAAVLIAGVTMNIVFAWLLFSVAFMVGVPTAVDEAAATTDAELQIQGVLPNGPAAVAGIPPGSVVESISVADEVLEKPKPSSFSAFIVDHEGEELTVEYTQQGETHLVQVTPVTDLLPNTPTQPALGVSLVLVENTSFGPVGAVLEAGRETATMLRSIVVGLFTLLVNTFSGTADYSQVAGPVGIVGMVEDAASFGWVALLMFTAMISLNLAVINLLPFPALDGGRLLLVAIEALLKREINPVWVARLNLVGFGLLLLLMVAVTYNDIAKLL